MSWTRKQYVTVAAVIVVAATIPMAWHIADLRHAQATDARQVELTDAQVPTRVAPDDYDGDGIPDATDVCPTRPETPNGFQDEDGCPDVVATTGAS